MNIHQLTTLLELHGTDPMRWPAAKREAAEQLLASDPLAVAAVAEFEALEQALDATEVPEFPGLQARILNQPLPPRRAPWPDRFLRWLMPGNGLSLQLWRPIIAACLPLVFGVLLGNFFSFGVLSESETTSWDEELYMLSLNEYPEIES